MNNVHRWCVCIYVWRLYLRMALVPCHLRRHVQRVDPHANKVFADDSRRF